jgi:transposase-like protein
LANLKTPLSRIVEILQALNEGLGVNAVCRVFGVSKNSLYRWQERLSDLKPTLLLYAWCHQFLKLVIEGDELYTKVRVPPRSVRKLGIRVLKPMTDERMCLRKCKI